MLKQLQLLLTATFISTIFSTLSSYAQNSSPYWSLAGNSNATSSSHKLGTTNLYPLRITTNNTTRIYISPSAGYVGIGTTAPSSRLHVNAASATSPLKFQINSITKLYMSSGGGLSVGSGSSAPSNGLYVSGNVGIGTSTPTNKLHVNGSGRFTSGVIVNEGGIQGNNSAPGGIGVYGASTYGEEGSYGVYGTGLVGVYGSGMVGTQGDGYTGVLGTGFTAVAGRSSDDEGTGVIGEVTGVNAYGVAGYSNSYIGVYGSTSNASSYAGYFTGNVYSTGTFTTSDQSLKRDITDITSAISLISKLHPKSYTYRQDGNYKLMNLPTGIHYGLIAQEVAQVFPDLVKTTTFETGRANAPQKPNPKKVPSKQASETISFKALNYTELIPIIIKGMQEQEVENSKLKAELAALKTANERLEERLTKLEAMTSANTITSLSGYLEQNTPNPVSGNTSIRYHVPETSVQAVLNLTNAKGQLVRTIGLTSSGSGQVHLNANGLASGTYNYTLYVDGKPVDTKRLVIAR